MHRNAPGVEQDQAGPDGAEPALHPHTNFRLLDRVPTIPVLQKDHWTASATVTT